MIMQRFFAFLFAVASLYVGTFIRSLYLILKFFIACEHMNTEAKTRWESPVLWFTIHFKRRLFLEFIFREGLPDPICRSQF